MFMDLRSWAFVLITTRFSTFSQRDEIYDRKPFSTQKETNEVNSDPSLINRNQKNLLKTKYKIFTNKYDEVKNAEELENEDEIIRLRKNLDQQLLNLQNIVAKLANKLQRQLLAKQNRSW